MQKEIKLKETISITVRPRRKECHGERLYDFIKTITVIEWPEGTCITETEVNNNIMAGNALTVLASEGEKNAK